MNVTMALFRNVSNTATRIKIKKRLFKKVVLKEEEEEEEEEELFW